MFMTILESECAEQANYSLQIRKSKPEVQLMSGREAMKPLRLSVKSSLIYFRLQVTATGVDEAEH